MNMKRQETKNCPYCGKEILAVAKKCKHCGKWLEVDDNTYSKEVRSKRKDSSNWRYLYIVVIVLVLGAAYLIPLHTERNKPIENNGYSLFNNVDELPADTAIIENGPVNDCEIDEVRQLLMASTNTKYTNARYGFSVMYPDCFVMGEEPQNGDGCGFSMKYGINFSVWGSYNDQDLYGENIQEYYKKDDDRLTASYHVQKDNWFVLSGDVDDERIYYKKVVLMEDDTERGSYITFYLLFPKKFNDVLADFINYEAKNFNPVYERTYAHNIEQEERINPMKNLQTEVQNQQRSEGTNSGLTRDQQIALFLLMLAAASDDGGSEMEDNSVYYNGLRFNNEAEMEDYKNAYGYK